MLKLRFEIGYYNYIGRVVKIYVIVMKAFMKKKRYDETQSTIKIGGKTSLGLNYFAL
jgi:hypothetical protein